jgi:hypothetical protein
VYVFSVTPEVAKILVSCGRVVFPHTFSVFGNLSIHQSILVLTARIVGGFSHVVGFLLSFNLGKDVGDFLTTGRPTLVKLPPISDVPQAYTLWKSIPGKAVPVTLHVHTCWGRILIGDSF